MKITGLKCVVVNAGMRNLILVRVDTDCAGLFGWGEATLEWKTRAVIGAVEDLSELIVGENPQNITRCAQVLDKGSFWRLGTIGRSAASAIEMALWDIAGKELSVPVWRLLGGKVRDRVRLYAHLGMGEMNAVYHSFAAERLVEHCAALKANGYTAAKIVNAPYSHYVAEARAVSAFSQSVHLLRQAVGPDFDIMIDFHGRPPSARVALDYIEAVRDARPLFIEEPVPPGDAAGLAYVRERSPLAIAAGERLIEPDEFETVMSARAVDIIQPDLCHCGGFTEARRVAQRAELLGIGVAPHNPAGPVASAAALHFALATPNHVIQEEMMGAAPWLPDILTQCPLQRESGYWTAPDAPGLGVDVDEAAAARHPFVQESLQTRNAVLADGGVTNW
jgi:galactonate dehydratase